MRTDQLRWAEPVSRKAVQREREKEREASEEGMLPSRTSARLSQFRLAMDKVSVASIRSVFVSAPKVSLGFSNCYFTFEMSSALGRYPTTKTLPHIYDSCCCCKVRGIYLLTAKEDKPRREAKYGERNRNQNRIDMNCERLRYFRFGHLPDYFVLCLRIGASSREGGVYGGKWSSQVNTRKRSRDLPCSSGLLFKAHAKCHCQLSEARLYRYLTG